MSAAAEDVKMDENTALKPKPTSAPAARTRSSAPFTVQNNAPWHYFLNPFAWLLWILDFVLFLLLPIPLLGPIRMLMNLYKPIQSRAVPNTDTRRNNMPDAGTELVKNLDPSCPTMHHTFMRAWAEFADRKCHGTRTFLRMYKPDDSRFPLKLFGETTWRTYREIGDRAAAFGSGLVKLGMVALPAGDSAEVTDSFAKIKGPHCLLIYEETCSDWMTAVAGAFTQSLCCATSYATLGMSSVGEALTQTNAPAILCNYKDVEKVANLKKDCPGLLAVIYTRNYVEAEAPSKSGKQNGVQIMSFDEVVEMGAADGLLPMQAPTPEHLGLIMYTSGSTGKPKGVMLSQGSICAAVAGFKKYFVKQMPGYRPDVQETYLAYLPLAHILEFCAECFTLSFGSAVGYSDTKTISSKGAARQRPDGTINRDASGFGNFPPGGIQEFAPTVMAAVPKIWDILKKGVEGGVGAKSGIIQFIFQTLFSARHAALQQGRSSPLADLFFDKLFRKVIGGRIKMAISGGGPISGDVQNFVRVAFKVNLIQGYALTETCASGTVQSSNNYTNGVVGPPLQSVEMRLNSCPSVFDREDKPYVNTDTMHLGTPCLGRGEVWIRGPPVSNGYYAMPEKTAEDFDSDKWFHTGDIAIFTADGQIKIVDRLKNLIKLKGGEYIAIEAMESTFSNSIYVNGLAGGIMCYGSGDMDRPVALVQVELGALKKWARGNGINADDPVALCQNPEACKMVTADLNKIGHGIIGANEKLAAVALLPGIDAVESTAVTAPWSPENNYLTASNKLNRKPIEKGFTSILEPLKQLGIKH